MSVFNPDQFEQMVIEQENQTSFIPVPEGDYEAYIESYEFSSFPSNGEERVVCNVNWLIPDEDLAASLGLEELKVRQKVWLDLTPEGGIDFGTNKNVSLGRLRQALGLNKPGFQWPSLIGQPGRISVGHQPNREDPSIVYSNVTRVASVNEEVSA